MYGASRGAFPVEANRSYRPGYPNPAQIPNPNARTAGIAIRIRSVRSLIGTRLVADSGTVPRVAAMLALRVAISCVSNQTFF